MNLKRIGWGALALLVLSWTPRFARSEEPAGAADGSSIPDASAPSQGGPLDLGAALGEAQARSPYYLGAQAAASEKNWGRLDAWSGFLPHVSLDGTRFFENAYQVLPVSFGGADLVFPEVYPYAQYGFDASWTLFDGWKGVNTLRASGAASRAADLDRDWSLFRLGQDVRLKFYRALASRELARLAEVNVSTLRDHLRIVRALLANGQATRFDLLRVEVQLDDALTDQMDALDQVALARRSLAVAMGEDGDARPLVGALPEPPQAPTDFPALGDKPDIKALLLKADAAHDAGLAQAGAWLPKVSVIGAYQWYYNGYNALNEMDPGDTAAHGTNYDLGLELSWGLFDGGGDLARQMEASRRADESAQTAKEAELQASEDRDTWSRKLATDTAMYRARQADVDKARESVRLAVDGLKAGTRTTTEVLDAELDSFRAEAGVVSAKLDADEALINLELALGTGDLP